MAQNIWEDMFVLTDEQQILNTQGACILPSGRYLEMRGTRFSNLREILILQCRRIIIVTQQITTAAVHRPPGQSLGNESTSFYNSQNFDGVGLLFFCRLDVFVADVFPLFLREIRYGPQKHA
jgi:hypothetical protein